MRSVRPIRQIAWKLYNEAHDSDGDFEPEDQKRKRTKKHLRKAGSIIEELPEPKAYHRDGKPAVPAYVLSRVDGMGDYFSKKMQDYALELVTTDKLANKLAYNGYYR